MARHNATTLPVLVVDDSAFMRRTMREVLSSFGLLNVAGAADGAEALERCREIEPALILLDWTMPFLDGPEFLKLLRTDAGLAGRDAAIVIVTSSPTRRLVTEAKRWGVDGIVRKPFSPGTLMARVQDALNRRDARSGRHPPAGVFLDI